MSPKDAYGMANSVDPAWGAIWSGSTLCPKTYTCRIVKTVTQTEEFCCHMRKYVIKIMAEFNAPINISPPPQRGEGCWGIPLGLNCQNAALGNLTNDSGTGAGPLDVSARKSQRNYVWIWRHAQGIFDTNLCHMGREFDPNFLKLSNALW